MTTFLQNLSQKLILGITLNVLFTCMEFFIGISSGSLSLISDASHNLTDVLSLGITFVACKMAQRKASLHKTYGYKRATILGALFNGLILLLLACSLFYEAYNRFYHPQVIEGSTVMLVGFLGVLVNGGVALLFLKERNNIAVHSAFLNMIFDALASAAALCAGFLILCTGYSSIDTCMSIVIGSLLLASSYYVLTTVIHLLLEGTPSHINTEKIIAVLQSIPAIRSFDDLHIWALSSQETALSCHIVVSTKDLSKSVLLIHTLKKKLRQNCAIDHMTIEVELAPCTPCHEKN